MGKLPSTQDMAEVERIRVIIVAIIIVRCTIDWASTMRQTLWEVPYI